MFEENVYITFDVRGINLKVELCNILQLPVDSPFASQIKHNYKTEIQDLTATVVSNWGYLYLNRNTSLFECVLDSLIIGELHFPHNICVPVIQKELEFWGYDLRYLAPCCLDRVLKHVDAKKTTKEIETQWYSVHTSSQTAHFKTAHIVDTDKGSSLHAEPLLKSHGNRIRTEKGFKDSSVYSQESEHHYRRWMENIFLTSNSSWVTKIWPILVAIVILCSFTITVIEAESFAREPSFEEVMATTNLTRGEGQYAYYLFHSMNKIWTTILDIAGNVILTFDFFIRLILTRNKIQFMKKFMSICDLICTISIWIVHSFLLYAFITNLDVVQLYNQRDLPITVKYVINVLIYIRILRFTRFGHIILQYKSLKVICLSLRRSWKDLIVIWILLCITSIFFATLLYVVEMETDTFFGMFQAFWWAMITITTVGYGDFYPRTYGGYLIGIMCSYFGTILVAMSTTILINSFLITYNDIEQIERYQKFYAKDKSGYMEVKL